MDEPTEVPHYPMTITDDGIVEGAKKILPLVRPDWDPKSLRFKIFTDGITNKLLGCFNDCEENDVVLIRVYGNKTDLLIDRKAETRNFKILNAAGLAPRLYATFETGLVYEYVPGEVLTVKTCRSELTSVLVARALADMHCAHRSKEEAALWRIIRQFMDLVSAEESRKFDLEAELEFLRGNLSSLESPIVFCHNDLLLANIIFDSNSNRVTFIDYEYAAFNYQAYDIANHFNEYAGVETVDYSLYPDREYQMRWIRIYFERYLSNMEGSIEVTEEDVRQLYDTVQKFTLASHFLWAIWALIQADNSSIDFDFYNYALIRFKEYYTRKSELFDC